MIDFDQIELHTLIRWINTFLFFIMIGLALFAKPWRAPMFVFGGGGAEDRRINLVINSFVIATIISVIASCITSIIVLATHTASIWAVLLFFGVVWITSFVLIMLYGGLGGIAQYSQPFYPFYYEGPIFSNELFLVFVLMALSITILAISVLNAIFDWGWNFPDVVGLTTGLLSLGYFLKDRYISSSIEYGGRSKKQKHTKFKTWQKAVIILLVLANIIIAVIGTLMMTGELSP